MEKVNLNKDLKAVNNIVLAILYKLWNVQLIHKSSKWRYEDNTILI